MVNVFGRNGGFKAIRDELMMIDQPLSKKRALLRLIFEVKDVLTEGFLNWFAVILAPIIEQVMSPNALPKKHVDALDTRPCPAGLAARR